MENNTPNTSTANNEDLSFLDSNESGIQLKDILFMVIRNIHWFILCAAIGAGISYYNVKGEEKLYSSSASIMLKSGVSGGSESLRTSAVLSEFTRNGVANSSIFNEMMIIRSQRLMETVVRRLDLNTRYSYTTRLAKRNKSLYKDSPVEVTFPDANEQLSASFVVTPKDNATVELSAFQGRTDLPVMTVNIGDEVNTPVGRVVVKYSWYYNESFNGTPIQINRQPVALVAEQYRNAVR